MSLPEYEITLEKLVYGGEAMGRLPDGRAVFLPFGLPGETVLVRLIQEKQNFARGEMVEVLKTSPDRITPKCKHFTRCGGCHYQHLPYEKQLQVKREILRDQLQRIGRIENPPIQPMVGSPLDWNYRNHVQFHLTGDGELGFINSNGNAAFPIEECYLPEPAIDQFWRELTFESRMDIERISLRSGREEELMLILESETDETPEIEIETDISIVHFYEDHPVVIAGQEHLFMDVHGREFRVSASSFFQVNTKMAEKMVEYLQSNLQISQAVSLLDVYCGVGLFSKFFAPKYGKVIGVESSVSAGEDFAFNLDEFDNVELYEGKAEEILPALAPQISQPVHVIVDPPRAGIDKRALDAILDVKPELIVYVSCDPATLARDAARIIQRGWHLKNVTPFDLFPQTYHIESISIFEHK